MIRNPEEFTKLMPKYFKTSNFKSFERQLHIYSFNKVKNVQKLPEFRHPLFRPENSESIGAIKRKVSPAFSDSEVISKLKRPDFSLKKECQALRKRVASFKKLKDQLKSQNEKWSVINQQIFCKLSFLKGISTVKAMKLLFLIFSLSNQFSPKLLFDLRTKMMELGGCAGDESLNIIEIFMRLRRVGNALREQISDPSYWSSRLLDQLVDVTCRSLRCKEEIPVDNHLALLFMKIDNFIDPNKLTSLLIKPEIDCSKMGELLDRRLEALKAEVLASSQPLTSELDAAQESFLNSFSWLHPSNDSKPSNV